MAKKISAIVIPAVIDTTGIDKGISSIKTKLSGVRGSIGTRNSGSGGVGGGGNFGAGLPHYGGSAVAIGAAAAVGAAAGGGGRAPVVGEAGWVQKLNRMNDQQKSSFMRSEKMSQNFLSRAVLRYGNRMGQTGTNMMFEGGNFMPPNLNRSGTGFQRSYTRDQALFNKGKGLRKTAVKVGEFSQKLRMSYGADNNGASSESMFTPKRLATGAITAGIAGAAYLRQNFTQGGIKSNFSDLSNLEGNPALYNRAAAIKRRTYGPTGMPTFPQAMILGSDLQSEASTGRRNAEGVASETDKLIAGVGIQVGKRVEFISSILTGAAFKGGNLLKGLKSVFS